MAALGELTRKEIAELLGVDQRSITNYQKESPPIPSKRYRSGEVKFPPAPCVSWYVEFRLRSVRTKAPSEIDVARHRQAVAAARKMELEVALLENSQIDTEKHLARLRRVCELAAGKVKGLSRYVTEIRAAKTDAEADDIADRMEDEVLRALQRVADEIEDDDGDDSSAVAA